MVYQKSSPSEPLQGRPGGGACEAHAKKLCFVKVYSGRKILIQ